MRVIARSIHWGRLLAVVLGSAGVACVGLSSAHATDASELVPRAEGWLVKSYGEIELPAAPKVAQSELATLKAIVAKRTADDVARYHWWTAGGPVYRWNELLLDEMQDNFVTLPLAARHLALLQSALDDAVATARHHRKSLLPAEVNGLDSAIKNPSNASSPSEYAATAAAAADVLGYLFPARAAHFAAKAEEAVQTRLIAGAEYPHEVAAGRAIGQKIAALAIARGKSDNSDAKWTGSVPEGPGRWKGTNPIAAAAGTWQPWVMAHASEFRPSEPPAFGSDQVKAALAELKAFARTPKSNHRSVYWEANGGARAHTLWNEIARTKLLEHRYGAPVSARILAALNIALADAGVGCWEAKYAFWYPRPQQLDPELKTVVASPNHPSYPSAHSCFSAAAATVLAAVFPRDRDRILAVGKEASDARIWAGIHYRFDVDAGEGLGRKVAARTLERAFGTRTN